MLLAFDDVAAGDAATRSFTVINPNPISVTLQRLTSTSPSFVAVNPTLPVTLAAGASQTVELRFDAQADLTEVQTATLRG